MKKLKTFLLLLTSILLGVIGLFLYYAVDVLIKFFPLDNPEAVVFTITNVVGDAYKVVWILLEPCVQQTMEFSVCAISLLALISMVVGLVYCKKKSISPKKCSLHQLVRIALIPFFFSVALIDVVIWGCFFYRIPIVPCIKAYGAFLDDSPHYNPLYEIDYVFPDSVSVVFGQKKNLILIFLESMEYNFQDSKNGGSLSENQIPEITNLMNENISFKPGGVTVKGTGWTMGETVAKTCALPLIMPIRSSDGIRYFFKNAVCLTDILHKNGYTIELLQGSDAEFASMNYFVKKHGVPQENIYDLQYYERMGVKVLETNFFSSVKDGFMYAEMKKILSNKTEQLNKPWMLWFYTLDTHGPYGRLDSNCVEFPKDLKMEDQYPYVLRCASKQVSDFIDWAEKQSWFENTVIAVMGDHPGMASLEVIGFTQEKLDRYWLNFFVNSSVAKRSDNRKFTSFDMFPTILEAMGAKIDGRALGLGRSLFSGEPTLLEKYGKDSLNVLLGTKSSLYDSFWK